MTDMTRQSNFGRPFGNRALVGKGGRWSNMSWWHVKHKNWVNYHFMKEEDATFFFLAWADEMTGALTKTNK